MNNEEKILQVLEKHGEMLEQQGKILEKQGEILAEMSAEQSEMKDLLQKVAVTQEGIVLPRLDLLAEGHTHLVDTLARKSRVEALEEEVTFMKTAIKYLSQAVADLKKAQ